MKIDRRKVVVMGASLAATSLLPINVLAQSDSQKTAEEIIQEFTGGAEIGSGNLMLTTPEIAENGNQVKVSFEMDSPMTNSDHIKTVYILADGNPSPNVAKFSFTPEMGSCSATTRIRLSKTQNVYLLAENNNGQFLMTNAQVKVTIGGCGG